MITIFVEIGLIIVLATVLGYVLKLLKQPIIPAYVIAGLLIGPVLGIIKNDAALTTMSDIGIAFLLFIVGLEINFGKLKDVGRVAGLGALINSSLLFMSGFLIATAFSFGTRDAIYLGLAVAFSSTMVVVKILSDERELDTLHGRIIVGVLLVEDLISITILSVMSNSGLLMSVLKFLGLLLGAVLLGRYALPAIFRNGAKHQELLFLLSLSLCFSFSMVALALGISIVIGAFIAGITIANLPYRQEIISRVKSLRDFFLIIFFVSLGTQISIAGVSGLVLPFLAFFILVILVKPFMLMNLVNLFGYTKKTSFLTGINLSQVSEFALIITALGRGLGQISDSVFTLTIMLAISTIVLSSYVLKYDSLIYSKFSGALHFLERRAKKEEEGSVEKGKEVILCGYNRIGFNIVNSLKSLSKDFLVVDHNPETIKRLMAQGVPCMYGDIGDVDVMEQLELSKASMVISTVPGAEDTNLLIQKVREQNKQAALIVTASQLKEAVEFYNSGADYVVLPHFLGGEHVSRLIEQFSEDPINIINTRLRHIEELQLREELGQEHPRHD